MWRDSKLLILLAIGSLTVMAAGVIAPVLPDIIHQLHLDPGISGTLVSLHFLTVALSVPLMGILADSIGALPVLIPALILYALFGIAGAFMPNLPALMASRALLGIATGGFTAASLGLIGKLYAGETRSQVIAYVSSTISLSNIVYPLTAGLLGLIHWRWAFALYGLALPVALLTSLIFREKPGSEGADSSSSGGELKGMKPNIGVLLGDRQTLQIFFTLIVTAILIYASVIYIPLYMRQVLGSTTVMIGVTLASKALGAAIVAAFGVRRIAQRVGDVRTIMLGFGVMALALVGITFSHHLAVLLPIVILFGMAYGIAVPCLYDVLTNRTDTALQASVLAIGTGSSFLGQFLSPLLLAPVFTHLGLSNVFYVAAIAAVAIALLLQIGIDPAIETHPDLSTEALQPDGEA